MTTTKKLTHHEVIEVEDVPQEMAALRIRCRYQDIKYDNPTSEDHYVIILGLSFSRRDKPPLDEDFIGTIGDLWIESTEDGKRTVIRDGKIIKQEVNRGVHYVTILVGVYDFILSEFPRKEHQGPRIKQDIPHYLSVLCGAHCHALGIDFKTYVTTAITEKLEKAEEVGVEVDRENMGLKVPTNMYATKVDPMATKP